MIVHLYRNLNQKQYIFVLRIVPTTAVKLFDSISLSRIGEGQFSVQTLVYFWVQINTYCNARIVQFIFMYDCLGIERIGLT